MRRLPAFLTLCIISALRLDGAEPLIKDGDRIVLLGGTAIEREQRYGYWEYAITAAMPDAKLTSRDLGWSGDTVWGEARAAFDDAAKGYQRLKELTIELKPTLIVLNYGANEAHAGPAGLEKFVAQYKKLLDDLATTQARFVLVKPLPIVPSAGTFADPATTQKNLDLYAAEVQKLGDERKIPVITLADPRKYGPAPSSSPPNHGLPVTDNGVHLTALGYYVTAADVAGAFGLPTPKRSDVTIRLDGNTAEATGDGVKTKVVASGKADEPSAIEITRTLLPSPAMPNSVAKPGDAVSFRFPSIRLTVKGLPAGEWALTVDGKPHGIGSAAQWAEGKVETGLLPDEAQADELLEAIRAKNQLYFYRWRPQNQTYLFGFRKHEQGRNAKEVAEFDPLVAETESRINTLKAPKPHQYRWTIAK